MPAEPKASLSDFLATQPLGPLAPPAAAKVLNLLAACWPEFEGCDDAAMDNGKVRRAERLTWNPPNLTFLIERHGGTVQGSTRAELQRWSVDLDRGIADWSPAGRRQIYPMAGRLDLRGLAEEVARNVRAGTDHTAIQWSPDRTEFRLIIDQIIPPTGFKQTMETRRQRFRAALAERLPGWKGYTRWKRTTDGSP